MFLNLMDPHLRFAQTVVVGNVEGVSGGGSVDTTGAALLQPQVVQDFGETCVLRSKKKKHVAVDTGSASYSRTDHL